jgi:hypothetical protein
VTGGVTRGTTWPSFPPICPDGTSAPPWSALGSCFDARLAANMMLRRDQPYARVVVPDHKQVRLGTLRRIIADAGLTVEQFVELLRR